MRTVDASTTTSPIKTSWMARRLEVDNRMVQTGELREDGVAVPRL